MKLPRHIHFRQQARRQLQSPGYTLTEVMVTMAVICLIMASVMSCHLFGMRLFEASKAKLGASDEARIAIGSMITEIRAAKLVRVGNGSVAGFVENAPNQAQAGNAIQIYPANDTNQFIRYFHDSQDRKLKRTTNGWGDSHVIASSISNHVVFAAEDFSGTILTNNENNRVIGVSLQFYQLQYPSVPIGPGNLYDFYQLRTKITRRTLE